MFLKKVPLIPKNWEQGVSLAGKPEQLERGGGGGLLMHMCLESCVLGKPRLYTANVAVNPSKRNLITISSC